MAVSGAIRAGRAYVEAFLDKTQLEKGLRQAQAKLQSFGKALMIVGGAMTAAFVAPVNAASAAMETASKFAAVFGAEADAAREFVEGLGDAVGRSTIQLMDGISAFQAFFRGLGVGAAEAREMAQQMTELAIDFGSFHNLTDEESLQRFISALSGSSEVLDRFGINIKASALNQELLRMGINKTTATATEQEKVLARMNIIMQSMGDQGAVGDAVRTSESFSNQMKRLKGEILDAQVAIGNALIPTLVPLLKWVGEIAAKFGEWAQNNQSLVVTVAKLAAGTLALGAGLLAVNGAIKVILGALAAYRMAVKAAAAAQAFLIALSGPKGWALVAGAAVAATVAVVGFNFAMGGTEEAADKAAEAIQNKAVPAMQQFAAPAQAAADTTSAFEKALKNARSPAEKLRDELAELNRLFAEHDPKGQHWDAYAASVRNAINASTGIFGAIRSVREEIGLLTGNVTENQLALQKMIEAGAPAALVAQYRELLELRDALTAAQEREKADEAEAERIRESVATPEERFEAEKKRLEGLRLRLGEETFERAMAAAQERFEKESAIGEGAKAFGSTVERVGPAGAERGSSEALSSIFAAMRGQQDPAEETAKLTKEQLAEQKRHTRILERLERNKGGIAVAQL